MSDKRHLLRSITSSALLIVEKTGSRPIQISHSNVTPPPHEQERLKQLFPLPDPTTPHLNQDGYAFENYLEAARKLQTHFVIELYRLEQQLPSQHQRCRNSLVAKYKSTLQQWEQRFLHNRRQSHRLEKHTNHRAVFNHACVPLLEKYFEKNAYPSAPDREVLAKRTMMTPRQIEVWFQNHRNRARKDGRPLQRLGKQISPLSPQERLPEAVKSSTAQCANQKISLVSSLPPSYCFPAKYSSRLEDGFNYKLLPSDWPRSSSCSRPCQDAVDLDDLCGSFTGLRIWDKQPARRRHEAHSGLRLYNPYITPQRNTLLLRHSATQVHKLSLSQFGQRGRLGRRISPIPSHQLDVFARYQHSDPCLDHLHNRTSTNLPAFTPHPPHRSGQSLGYARPKYAHRGLDTIDSWNGGFNVSSYLQTRLEGATRLPPPPTAIQA